MCLRQAAHVLHRGGRTAEAAAAGRLYGARCQDNRSIRCLSYRSQLALERLVGAAPAKLLRDAAVSVSSCTRLVGCGLVSGAPALRASAAAVLEVAVHALRDPAEALRQAVPGEGAARLHVPVVGRHLLQGQRLRHLEHAHRVVEVLRRALPLHTAAVVRLR